MTTRPGTSPNFFEDEFRRSTSPFRNHDPAVNPYSSRQFPMFMADKKIAATTAEDKEHSQENAEAGEQQDVHQEKEQQEHEAAEEEEEREEDEGEESPDMTAYTERKTFTNDRLIGYVQMVRDQLVPVADRSNYAFFSPNGEIIELQAEQRWREQQHRQLIKKREREEVIGMIDEWAHAKSRIEDESMRKGEAMRYGSLFETRAFTPQPQTATKDGGIRSEYREVGSRPNTTRTGVLRRVPTTGGSDLEKEWPPKNLNLESDDEDEANKQSVDGNTVTVYRERGRGHLFSESVKLSNIFDYQLSPRANMRTGTTVTDGFKEIELEMNKMKIARVREVHGNFIKSKQAVTPREGKTRTPSLTVFQHQAVSVKNLKKIKPLSLITRSMTAAAFKDHQLNEIDQIKKSLAKSQTPVSMKALSRGLLLPESTPKESLSVLPTMGSRLMMNPFVAEKKKKKARRP